MICSTGRTIVTPGGTITPISPPIKNPSHFSHFTSILAPKSYPLLIFTRISLLHLKTQLILTRKPPPLSSLMAMDRSAASSSLMLTSGASGRINALFSVQALKSFLILINAVVLFLLLPFRGRRRTVPISSSTEKPKDFEKLQDCGSQRKMVRVPATIVPWKSSSSSGSGGVVVDQEVATRRALAICRVLQDDDPNSLRESSLFVTARGDTLFTQLWTPVSVRIR